ncbi:MAG: GIY-YIG nuclease family protein [Methylococcales bacterium]|nr:GIY-YIG nuclease family protein [Methylococcales bacterium]
MIRCTDDTLYTGISNDVKRRYLEHGTPKGAKYFRGRLPVQLVYQEAGHDRSSASKREWAIKKLSRQAKDRLILSVSHTI